MQKKNLKIFKNWLNVSINSIKKKNKLMSLVKKQKEMLKDSKIK